MTTACIKKKNQLLEVILVCATMPGYTCSSIPNLASCPCPLRGAGGWPGTKALATHCQTPRWSSSLRLCHSICLWRRFKKINDQRCYQTIFTSKFFFQAVKVLLTFVLLIQLYTHLFFWGTERENSIPYKAKLGWGSKQGLRNSI